MSLTANLVRHYPAAMLGLGDPDLTAETARDRLADIGRAEPEVARALAYDVMTAALELIRDGHSRAGEVATFALTVCSAKFTKERA